MFFGDLADNVGAPRPVHLLIFSLHARCLTQPCREQERLRRALHAIYAAERRLSRDRRHELTTSLQYMTMLADRGSNARSCHGQ